jgi:hypothetical protein
MAELPPITLTVVQVIKAADVQAGDTVYFSHPGKLSHVGLERFVDAAKRSFPDGVKVTVLEEGMTIEGILRFGSNEAEA